MKTILLKKYTYLLEKWDDIDSAKLNAEEDGITTTDGLINELKNFIRNNKLSSINGWMPYISTYNNIVWGKKRNKLITSFNDRGDTIIIFLFDGGGFQYISRIPITHNNTVDDFILRYFTTMRDKIRESYIDV